MNIKKRINLYCENGLITQDQVDNILNFEKEFSRKNTVLSKSVSLIASSLIGIGIIALVVFNWGSIPGFIKLLVDLAIWGILIFELYKHDKDEQPFIKNVLLSFALFYVAATIGLIHQVFHLPYELYEFFSNILLMWSLLCLPFIIPNRFLFFNIIWVVIFFTGVCATDTVTSFVGYIASPLEELLKYLEKTNLFGIGILLAGIVLGAISIPINKLSKKVYHTTLIPRAVSVILDITIYASVFASLIPEAFKYSRCYVVFPLGILFYIFLIFTNIRLGKIGSAKLYSASCMLFIFIAYGVYINYSTVSILLVGMILGAISILINRLSNKVYHTALIPRAALVLLSLIIYASAFASLIPEALEDSRGYAVFPLGILFFVFMIFINSRLGKIGLTKFYSISCVVFIFIAYGTYVGFSTISFAVMSIISGAVLLGLVRRLGKKN